MQFDAQFDAKGLDSAERFSPIIENLKEQRKRLFASIDMIMYHPVLFFGASEDNRQTLIDYIQAWEGLYHKKLLIKGIKIIASAWVYGLSKVPYLGLDKIPIGTMVRITFLKGSFNTPYLRAVELV